MMNILRAEHSAQYPYVVMSKETANNRKLSLAARGLLAWLLDKPDTWDIDPDAIARLNNTTIYEIKKLLKELTAAGYLIPPKRDHKNGRWQYTPYILRETPSIPVDDEIQSSENSDAKFSHLNFRHLKTDELLQSDCNSVTVFEPLSRAEDKHEFAAEQITKINNNSNPEEQETTTTAPVAQPELPAPVTVSGSGGGYDIPVLDSVDLWESNATTLPAEIQAAARIIPVQSAVSSTPPPVAPPPSPEVKPLSEQDTAIGRVARAYERYIGGLDSRSPDILQTAIEDFGEVAVRAAIEGAFGKDSPWRYALGTLRRQRTAGTLPRSDMPVPALAPAKLASEHDAIFNRDEKQLEPEPEPEPVNAQWRELGYLLENQYQELHRLYFSQCRFGGFDGSKLTVLVPTERVQSGCIWEMNHRGAFTKWCQDFWQGLKTVEFVLEDLPDAVPVSA